jgi:adhesin transport system outer membrane protein
LIRFGQIGFAQPLSLNDSVREILDTHPKVIEKLKDYNSGVFEKNRVRSGFYPALDVAAGAGYEQVSNSSTGYQNEDSKVSGAKISLKQLIFDGGFTSNNVHAKTSLAKAKLFDYCNEANTVAFQSIEAYVNLLKYDRLQALATENTNIHKKILESVRARTQAGTGGSAEVSRVQGRLAAAQSKSIARYNDYKRAVYKYHQFIGRYVDAKELVRPGFNSSLLPANLKAAFNRQSENHPNLIAADFNIDAKKWQYKRDKSIWFPTLHLEASKSWQNDFGGIDGNNEEAKIMLELRYSLFDGGVRRALAGKNTSLIYKQQQIRTGIKRSVLADLQLTWTGYKLLDSQIGALRKNMFYTREALSAYKEEFNLGKRNLINILDAENEYQNSRAMLASTEYDLITAKYRILYSMGTTIEDLNLTSPLIEELKNIKKIRPVSKDKLPLNADFDMDEVVNKKDVSDNSEKDEDVNILGADKEKTGKYLEEPVDVNKTGKEIMVTRKSDLDESHFKTDVAVKLNLISFKRGSVEMSQESKRIMRGIIEHVKPLAMDGVIQITVNSNDMNTNSENYVLGLQRAYNIMHIFAMHNMDPEGMQVFANVGRDKLDSSLSLKIVTNLTDFKKGYRTIANTGVKFNHKKTTLIKQADTVMAELAAQIKGLGNPALDIIVYSNDADGSIDNRIISRKRAQVLKNYLKNRGCNVGYCVPVAWGTYQQGFNLYNETNDINAKNKVKFVVRIK